MPSRSPEPSDLPGELPELDDEPDADEPLPDESQSLLDVLSDEDASDLDDEVASNLDIGIDLALELEAAPEAGEELVLDIGELLDGASERDAEGDEGDEASGPAELDAAIGIAPLPEGAPLSDDDDAPLAPDEIAGELPALDADEAGESGEEPNWLEIDALAGNDQPMHDANRRWHATPIAGVDRPCRDLALAHGDLLVGGDGLWRVQRASAELLFEDDKPIESIAVTMGSVVYVNSAGLMRRLVLDAGGNSAAPIGAIEEATQLVASVHAGDRIVAVSGSRAAFESADGGRTWSRVAAPGRVLALPRRGDRLLLLLERNGDRVLALDDGSAGFRLRRLEQAALLVASGDAPLIDVLEDVVVLLDPSRGLLVSADGGERFAPVAGCAGASAVCLGRFDGAVRAWVALYSDWTGKTEIAMIDPASASAERIAALSFPGSGDDAEPLPTAGLCWDAAAARLWVAGPHGLLQLEPEDADADAPLSAA